MTLAGEPGPKAKASSPNRSARCLRWLVGGPGWMAGPSYRPRLFGDRGNNCSWRYRDRPISGDGLGLLCQIHTPEDREHEDAANDSEGRHEIKVIAPALVEKRSQKIA